MDELLIQTQLVDAIKKEGGFAYKTNHKYIAGLPDIVAGLPEVGTVHIEIKLIKGGQKAVLTTPLQQNTIKVMQNSGMKCGVLVINYVRDGEADIYFTNDPYKNKIDEEFVMLKKTKGKPWPVLEIMKLCSAHAALCHIVG